MTQQQNWKISSSQQVGFQDYLYASTMPKFYYGFSNQTSPACLCHQQTVINVHLMWFVVISFINFTCYLYLNIMKNPWKFESIQRLSSKVSYSSNGSMSAILPVKFDSFPPPQKDELESFTLMQKHSQGSNEKSQMSESEKPAWKSTTFVKLDDSQKRPREREEFRKGRGLSAKMKTKLQQQLKNVNKQLQEKGEELSTLNNEIEHLSKVLRQRKRSTEELLNNQQMLQFKEKQLSNLMTIHAELLQGAKKDILHEKNTKLGHEEKIISLKKKIGEVSNKIIEKREMWLAMEKLKDEKEKLQALLQSRKETQAKKSLIRNQAIRELLQQVVKRNKKELQQECEHKVRQIREASSTIKRPQDLKQALEKKNITPQDYFTFAQLKYVPELNFRLNKEAEKIMEIFYREVNPKIPEIIEHFEEPAEFLRLKQELQLLEKSKQQKEVEMKRKQMELEKREEEMERLKKNIAELKQKTQIK